MGNSEEYADPVFAVEQLINNLQEMVSSERYLTLIAQYKFKYYQSLLAAGFDEKQALMLTSKTMGGM